MTKSILTDVQIDGSVTADSIIKSGGTAEEILLADGTTKTATVLVEDGTPSRWQNTFMMMGA